MSCPPSDFGTLKRLYFVRTNDVLSGSSATRTKLVTIRNEKSATRP